MAGLSYPNSQMSLSKLCVLYQLNTSVIIFKLRKVLVKFLQIDIFKRGII